MQGLSETTHLFSLSCPPANEKMLADSVRWFIELTYYAFTLWVYFLYHQICAKLFNCLFFPWVGHMKDVQSYLILISSHCVFFFCHTCRVYLIVCRRQVDAIGVKEWDPKTIRGELPGHSGGGAATAPRSSQGGFALHPAHDRSSQAIPFWILR